MTIRAIYENGVFRPMHPIKLAEGKVVELEICEEVVDVRALVPPGTDESLIRIYEILGERYDSGFTDLAERHNDHQP